MSLSLNKLTKILKKSGLISKKFFLIDNYCIYIEVFSIDNVDNFLIYIPSKYDLKFNGEGDAYNLSVLDIPEDGIVPVDYAGDVDKEDLEETYDNVELDLNLDDDLKIEEKLNENYQISVSLKDTNREDTNRIREIFRQLKRLKYSVQNIKYKICIFYKNYICCIRRDNTYDGFLVKELDGGDDMKLMVTTDLENFIKNSQIVSHDVKTVRESIYKILQKNQNKHVNSLRKMLEYKNGISDTFLNIRLKQKKYVSYIAHLENLFKTTNEQENKILLKISEANQKYDDVCGVKGIHTDIERSHVIGKLEEEIHQLKVVKQDIMKNIVSVKSKLENLCLRIDEICFDNIVMLDAITRNFNNFSKIT